MKANECKCIECGSMAVAFYPCIDIDIKSYPYCRKCLRVEQFKIMKLLNDWK